MCDKEESLFLAPPGAQEVALSVCLSAVFWLSFSSLSQLSLSALFLSSLSQLSFSAPGEGYQEPTTFRSGSS